MSIIPDRMQLPSAGMPPTRLARWVLNALVAINVVAQALAAGVIALGKAGTTAAPVAAGSVLALFLLMFLYARWMFPFLKRHHVLAILMMKEVGIMVLLALVAGVIFLARALT